MEQLQGLLPAAPVLNHDEGDGGVNDGAGLQRGPEMLRVNLRRMDFEGQA